MAKKIIKDKNGILEAYTQELLKTNEKPKSIYAFCEDIKISEKEFYAFFTNFDQLEESVFTYFFDATVSVLNKSEDYESYDAKTKLLSFYFTFFEQLSANKTLILMLLENGKPALQNLKKLSALRVSFKEYVDQLGIKSIDLPKESLEKLQQKSISEMAWLQLMATLKFWIDDTSAGFEKTDVFIEKSVQAGFDFLSLEPLKNIIDFGKFIWQEKVKC